MAHFTWILALACVVSGAPSSASGAPASRAPASASGAPSSASSARRTLAVPSGSNVSLSCNLSSSEYQTWFRLDSDRILPLFTVRPHRLGGGVIREDHHQGGGGVQGQEEGRRHGYWGDLEAGVSLEIRAATEEDSGVYICSSKNTGELRFNTGVYLRVTDPDHSPVLVRGPRSCWSPELCLIPGLVSVALLCTTVVCLCCCKGKCTDCCCSEVTEDFPLHYSSLKHMHKPRPSGRADVRLVEEDVIYSSVNHHRALRSQ